MRISKDKANSEARKVYYDWLKKTNEIEQRAKADGTWSKTGLDANNHLFKEANEGAKKKLEEIRKRMAE